MLSKLGLFATFEVTRCSDYIAPPFKRATRVAIQINVKDLLIFISGLDILPAILDILSRLTFLELFVLAGSNHLCGSIHFRSCWLLRAGRPCP